jgi:hypothetical protein
MRFAYCATRCLCYLGYSIGRWTDEDAQGRHTVLEVETRGFKGPRADGHLMTSALNCAPSSLLHLVEVPQTGCLDQK